MHIRPADLEIFRAVCAQHLRHKSAHRAGTRLAPIAVNEHGVDTKIFPDERNHLLPGEQDSAFHLAIDIVKIKRQEAAQAEALRMRILNGDHSVGIDFFVCILFG